MDVVKMLNLMYTLFDDISAKFDVYKIATIGDAYFVASGVPKRNGTRHAQEIISMAISLLKESETFVIPHLPSQIMKIRIGIHTGPCVAGVVGVKTPRYLLFGETVDIASKMESTGKAMKIHISETTAKKIEGCEGFVVALRITDIPINGLECINTYWVEENSTSK